ncbi:MAG: PHP domain-containing protein [Clostridia bacterium]|nr:PHP domain-containing protein [Clostridia bacterium]
MKIDLHMHSTASDGVLTPLQLAHRAAQEGVRVMALTDHDTLDGATSLMGQSLPLRLLPGVELSLRDRKGLHLLGYGLRQDTPLHSRLRWLAQARIDRARKMAALLERAGMPIDIEGLMATCAGSVGRPHLAREMVKRGYVADVQDAFALYLKEGRPCYVAGDRLSMDEALPLMRESGFVPVLAHPCELDADDMTLRALVRSWQSKGLMGMEVYHPSARSHGFAALDKLARSMGLLVTGGSDFHQEDDRKHGLPGCTSPDWRQAEDDLAALETAMNQR